MLDCPDCKEGVLNAYGDRLECPCCGFLVDREDYLERVDYVQDTEFFE